MRPRRKAAIVHDRVPQCVAERDDGFEHLVAVMLVVGAQCHRHCARRRRFTEHFDVPSSIGQASGGDGVLLVLRAARDDRDAHGTDLLQRRQRLSRQVGGRPAPPVASCHVSRTPSLLVSRPYCALRLTTSLMTGFTGPSVGSCSGAQHVCRRVDRVCDAPHRRGWPEIDQRPRSGAVGRAQCPAIGVCASVAKPVTPSTATPPALIVDTVQLAPFRTAAIDVVRAESERTRHDVRFCGGRGLHERHRCRQRTRPAVQHGDRVWIAAVGPGVDEDRNRSQQRAGGRVAAEEAMPLPAMEISRPRTNSP